MKELFNSFDKEVSFTNLEDARNITIQALKTIIKQRVLKTFLESQASSRNISNSGMNTRTL